MSGSTLARERLQDGLLPLLPKKQGWAIDLEKNEKLDLALAVVKNEDVRTRPAPNLLKLKLTLVRSPR